MRGLDDGVELFFFAFAGFIVGVPNARELFALDVELVVDVVVTGVVVFVVVIVVRGLPGDLLELVHGVALVRR